MDSIKLGGSTMHLAEATIDYKTKTIDLKGVPDGTLINRLTSALLDWGMWLTIVYFGIIILLQQLNVTFKNLGIILAVALVVPILAIHSNKKMDIKIKKWFAKRTGKGKRNCMTAKDFNSKDFVIYNTKNVVVDFEATGDVAKQLSKIMTREEESINILLKQANIKNISLNEGLIGNKKWWNVYFVFEEIPKDGELYVEFI